MREARRRPCVRQHRRRRRSQRDVPDHFARRRVRHLAIARRRRREMRGRLSTAAAARGSSGPCHSFSTTIARAIASSFTPIAANGVPSRALVPFPIVQPLDVARNQVHLDVDLAARAQDPQRRHGQCMRDQVDGKSRARRRCSSSGSRRRRRSSPSRRYSARARPGTAIASAGCPWPGRSATMLAHRVPRHRRARSSDGRPGDRTVAAPFRGSPRRRMAKPVVQARVSPETSNASRGGARATTVRQQPRPRCCRRRATSVNVEAAGIHVRSARRRPARRATTIRPTASTMPVNIRTAQAGSATLRHDGEVHHAVSVCPTRATMRRSSPIRSTDVHSRSTRSASDAIGGADSNIPRAGSPISAGREVDQQLVDQSRAQQGAVQLGARLDMHFVDSPCGERRAAARPGRPARRRRAARAIRSCRPAGVPGPRRHHQRIRPRPARARPPASRRDDRRRRAAAGASLPPRAPSAADRRAARCRRRSGPRTRARASAWPSARAAGAGDPLALAARQRGAAVEAGRELGPHPGPAARHPRHESEVQLARLAAQADRRRRRCRRRANAPLRHAARDSGSRHRGDDAADARGRAPRRRTGGVRPWRLQGSSVTYSVAPRGSRAASARIGECRDLGMRLAGALDASLRR